MVFIFHLTPAKWTPSIVNWKLLVPARFQTQVGYAHLNLANADLCVRGKSIVQYDSTPHVSFTSLYRLNLLPVTSCTYNAVNRWEPLGCYKRFH